MGIRSNVRAAFGRVPRPDYLASPFTEGQLQKLVWSELFGLDNSPISRAEAMAIPAMAKARNLIAGTIAKLPLRAADINGVLVNEKQPRWTYRTDGQESPFLRMLWTVDDLVFSKRSLWEVTRGSDGLILTADHVRMSRWKTNGDGEILVDDELVEADSVIYFDGPTDALLDAHASTLRAARSIAAAVETRVKTPIPVMEIHDTGDTEIEPDEAKKIVTDYNKARRDPDGATVWTPEGITLIAHGDKSDAGFMVEGRNQVRLDIANITGVPAALLDGTTSSASLTYSTQEGRRNEFVDFSLVIWMEAIAGRLSADDVVPRGQSVVFDQTDFLTTLPSPTGTPEQD